MRKVYLIFAFLALSIIGLWTPQASAQLMSATDSVIVTTTGGTGGGWGRGFGFTPNQDLFVSKMGKRVPSAGDYSWVIWDAVTQSPVYTQVSLQSSPGNWIYEDCDSIIRLSAGHAYILELYGATGGASYYYGASSQVNSHLTYNDMIFCNSCTNINYPTSTLTNLHYGTPDFLFTLDTVPCSGMPVAGNAQASVHTVCLNQNVLLSAIGSTMAPGLTYQWESSTTANGIYTPIAGATGSTFTYNANTPGTTFFRLALTCSGQTAYSTPDSVVTPNGFAGGTYTIDPNQPASATNFQTVSDAFAAAGCGINGSIIFNMAAGNTFNEQVTVPGTTGTTASKTITLNGNGDTLSFNGTSVEPWTLGLEGADHITINNLVIQGTNTAAALVAHLWDNADSNTFHGCTILAPYVSSSLCVPVSISGSATSATATTGLTGNGNVFDSCVIKGGYYGVAFYANSGNLALGNKLKNSRVEDFYYYGNYNYYQDSPIISGNHISRPTATTISSFYGIYLSTGTVNALVEGNRLDHQNDADPTGSHAVYNIYVSSTTAIVGGENKVFNNVIGNVNGNSTMGGIYLPSAVNVQVYNNTVSLDNTAATTGTVYGIYSTGSAGVDVKNNIISITQGGTGTKYGLYYSSQNPTSNYNDIFMGSTTGTVNYGYASGAITSFALWQAANGGAFDQNSISEDPLFADPGNGDFTPTNAAVNDKGTPVTGVTTDILGATRSTTTPDIGAYEFTVADCTGTVTAGTIDNGPTLSVCAASQLSLHASNATAPAAGLTYQWQQRVPSGTGTWQDIPGATLLTLNLPNGITAPTDFRAYMACSFSSSSDTTTPVTVNLNPGLQCYCTPTGAGNNSDDIANFTLANLNHSSTSGTSTTAPGYSDFTGTVAPADLVPLQSYVATVTSGIGSGNHGAAIWIDYNDNGAFESSEMVANISSSILGGATGTFPAFTVANNPGIHRLRVQYVYNQNGSALDPCVVSTTYGETEDYLVSIMSLTSCTGQPTAGAVDSSSFSVCAGIPFLLTDTGATLAAGMTYQWQQRSPSGTGTWTDISGGNSLSLSVPGGIAAATDYRFYVVCNNSSNSDTTAPITLSITPANQCYCIPTSTSTTYGITNFSTTGALVDINHSSAGGQGYVNNSATDIATQIPGGTVNFSVTVVPTEGVGIWVDWNDNGNFTDPGEQVFNSGAYVSSVTGSFNIPLTTSLGIHRMRVVGNGVTTAPTPCGDLGYASYGEAEDYSLNIMPLASCDTVTLPSNIAATIDQDTICANGGGNINLGLDTSLATVGGLTYQWQKSSNGTSGWTNMGTAQMVPPITDPNVSANTWYRCQILCDGTLDVTTSTISVFVSNPSLGTVPSDQDICGTSSVTLNATATGGSSVHWYDADAGGNLLGTGNSYVDTFSQTDTVWVAAGTGGGGMPQSLLTTTAAGNSAYGNLFDIDVTNTIRIDSFSIAAMTPGTQVGIYYRVGTGTGFNTSNTGWTLLGTATINNVGSPLSVIPLFVNLTLSPGTYSFALSASTSVSYSNGTSLGNMVVSDANVAIKEGYGGSSTYPTFGFTNQPRVWNGTLYYSLSGCESPRQPVVITVHDSVDVQLGNDTTICEGTPFTLDAGTPGSTYTWNTGATTETISVSDSGTYSVHVVAPWGCEGDGSINVNVTPLPHVDDITAVHNGDDSYTFTANNVVGAVNYSWDFGDGQGFSSSAHPTYLYGAYGDYTVTLIISNDCGADTTQLIVHYTSGDEGISNVDPGKNLLKLYPNPARDIVTLSNESSQRMQTVEVYNVLGQRIFKANTNNGSTYQLHVDGYASGMYSVKIFFEDGTWAQRKFEIAK